MILRILGTLAAALAMLFVLALVSVNIQHAAGFPELNFWASIFYGAKGILQFGIMLWIIHHFFPPAEKG